MPLFISKNREDPTTEASTLKPSFSRLFAPKEKLDFDEALQSAAAGKLGQLVDSEVQGALKSITGENKHSVRVGLLKAKVDGIDSNRAGATDEEGNAFVREKAFGSYISPKEMIDATAAFADKLVVSNEINYKEILGVADKLRRDLAEAPGYPLKKKEELGIFTTNEAMHVRLIQLGQALEGDLPAKINTDIKLAFKDNAIQDLNLRTNKDLHELLSDAASLSYHGYDAVRILANQSAGIIEPGYACSQSFCYAKAKQFLSAKIKDPETLDADRDQAKAGLSMLSASFDQLDTKMLAKALGKDGLDFIQSQYQTAGRIVYGAVKGYHSQN